MAKSKSSEEVGTPPYLPWVTFIGFLRQLKTTSIPTRIDSTVLKGRSGSDQSGIKTALRYFGLISADDTVTQKLRDLVAAMDGEHWQQVLGDLVIASYLDLTESLDLDNGTLGELQDAFTLRGHVTGSVREKAIRFWLAAMREAGMSISTHFGSSAPTNGNGRKSAPRVRKRGAGAARTDDALQQEAPPPDVKVVSFPIPGKPDIKLWLPTELSEAQWEMLDTYIRAFIKLRASA
jgi:hypothetical protein